MFVFDWLKSTVAWALESLGLWQKDARLLFLGLDNAGKSTLLHLLQFDKMAQLAPTMHSDNHEVKIGNVNIKAYDLGGHFGARKNWKTFFYAVDAIVFIIDTADRDRLPESKKELDTLLSEELLADKPFLILGNKCDVPGCTNEQELRQIMGLLDTTGREKTTREAGVRPIELFMCSLTKRYGYGEGLKWLTNFV